MNTLSIDFEPFVEWDNSPFILFSNQGKILYLNNAAEILFGYVAKKELYDIALAYAPQSFGYKSVPIETGNLITTDINILLEANIALFKTKNQNRLQLLTDQDIPAFKTDQNNFSKLLRKVLDAFRSSDSISITLKLLIGEHVIIADKKESIVQLSIEANGRYTDTDNEIRTLAEQSHIAVYLKERAIKLDIPLIQ